MNKPVRVRRIVGLIIWHLGGRMRRGPLNSMCKDVPPNVYYIARWDWLDRWLNRTDHCWLRRMLTKLGRYAVCPECKRRWLKTIRLWEAWPEGILGTQSLYYDFMNQCRWCGYAKFIDKCGGE